MLKYLPPILQQVIEFQKIMEAEQPEFDSAKSNVNSAMDDQFIIDATEYGVKRWEKMLNITPKSWETLEDRKSGILAKISSRTPYTFRMLEEQLKSMCEGDCDLILDATNYTLQIRVGLSKRKVLENIQDLVKWIVPANLVVNVSLKYNRHIDLAAFTHAELADFTHQELREEELPNGD